MKAFVSILPEILTPFGLVHINGLEAKHAAYMPYRPKRVKLLGPECQLGECRGAMATVQRRPTRSSSPPLRRFCGRMSCARACDNASRYAWPWRQHVCRVEFTHENIKMNNMYST